MLLCYPRRVMEKVEAMAARLHGARTRSAIVNCGTYAKNFGELARACTLSQFVIESKERPTPPPETASLHPVGARRLTRKDAGP